MISDWSFLFQLFLFSDVTNIKLAGQTEPIYLSPPLVADYGITHGHVLHFHSIFLRMYEHVKHVTRHNEFIGMNNMERVERCLCFPPVKLFPVTCEYIQGEKQFYYRAQRFYEDVPASEEGMMGDFVEISNVDLEGSRQFLKRFVVSHTSGPVRCILDEDLTKTNPLVRPGLVQFLIAAP